MRGRVFGLKVEMTMLTCPAAQEGQLPCFWGDRRTRPLSRHPKLRQVEEVRALIIRAKRASLSYPARHAIISSAKMPNTHCVERRSGT
jgi:hypothetical protein